MDPVRPLVEFADRLVHVHAKDARVDRQRIDDVGILATPLEYHIPKLPGLGDVPWGRFFAVLGEVGYRGPVCVEVEDRAYEDSLAGRRAALVQSHDFLRTLVAWRAPLDGGEA
jgi:sugar phosphate isomerase/epimerase